MHPETIDAMDYLYANHESVLGMCTFCYYHMIEYGVRDPNAMVEGAIGGKELTYITDLRRTIATPGIWFPFHAVVTTDHEWRPLRGWDRTHEYDAAYELVETIFAGHNARPRGVEDQLALGCSAACRSQRRLRTTRSPTPTLPMLGLLHLRSRSPLLPWPVSLPGASTPPSWSRCGC